MPIWPNTGSVRYWQYRTYVAQYRPALTLTGTTPITVLLTAECGTPRKEATIMFQQMSDDRIAFPSAEYWFTGGTIALQSDITLETDFDKTDEQGRNKYITAPLSVRFVQPLFRYNSPNGKKTEPLNMRQPRDILCKYRKGPFRSCS